jgi:predicted RNA-binding Zn ribbon-like protein
MMDGGPGVTIHKHDTRYKDGRQAVDLPWTDFLNSLQRDWRHGGPAVDHLTRADWQQAFLRRWEMEAPVPARAVDLERARALRDLLGALAARVTEGGTLANRELAALNEFMAGSPVRRELVPGYAVTLRPLVTGWPAVLGEVAASFARTLAEADPGRIRLCANPDCRWAFYDDTRNGSKRYCAEEACGNLMRVRRFRSRRR